MSEASVWALLAAIPIGTVVAWISVIFGIIMALCVGITKLYKLFIKYKGLKDRDSKNQETLNEYGNTIIEIKNTVVEMQTLLSRQNKVQMKQIRSTLIHICDDALAAGEITAWNFRLLSDVYEDYINVFHANGYVKEIVERTMKLPIVGKLEK